MVSFSDPLTLSSLNFLSRKLGDVCVLVMMQNRLTKA